MESHLLSPHVALAKVMGGSTLSLNDHARHVGKKMGILLRECSLVRGESVVLTEGDVARLSFLASLHDAGKAGLAFQSDMKLLASNPDMELPRFSDHVMGLWYLLCSTSCGGFMRDILMPERNPAWFINSVTEFRYWGALLGHHLRSGVLEEPGEDMVSNDWDEPLIRDWDDDDDGYSPCGTLRKLVSDMESHFLSGVGDSAGELPSSSAFVKAWADLVRKADQRASEAWAAELRSMTGGFGSTDVF